MQNSSANLFIPKKITVGFNKRQDTFSGRLAFITYRDEKNMLRQEKSWENWREKSMGIEEHDNVPSNYIFNKGVERSGCWGSGRSVIRVFDHRNFEFEIGVDNLIGILMHSDVSKRDIVEPCVYAWAGKSLVLLPINSVEYQKAIEYTEKQSKSIEKNKIKEGMTFAAKKDDKKYVYLGHMKWYERVYKYNKKYFHGGFGTQLKGKKHVFHDGSQFVCKDWSFFSHVLSDDIHPNVAHWVEEFLKTINGQAITGWEIRKAKVYKNDSQYVAHFYMNDNGTLTKVTGSASYKETTLKIKKDYRMEKIANNEIFILKGKDSDFITWNSWHDGAVICTIPKNFKEEDMENILKKYNMGDVYWILEDGTAIHCVF